jgi:hypothetical protein
VHDGVRSPQRVDRLTVIDQVGDELLAPDLCRAHEVDAQHLLSVLE